MPNIFANKVLIQQQQIVGAHGQNLFKRRWIYHVLFWFMYYLLVSVVFFFVLYGINDFSFYVKLVSFFPLEIALVYFNIYVLIPRLLSAGKYFYYCLSLLFSIVVVTSLEILLRKVYAHSGSKVFGVEAAFTFRNLTFGAVNLFYLVGLTTGIKFLKDTIINQQWMKEKERQYLETELNFLKTQIQPHFFFNTLNNLYSLTLKKSDLAPEVVLKLSDLMSYMLYESNTPKVSLAKEITYLQNYIDVEKLRFGDRLTVSFLIEGYTQEVSIPPMILILFIENSFKHGVKNNINKLRIDIFLKVEEGFLFFEVRNPLAENSSVDNNGIGLKNVRRRLDLLYGSNYFLGLSTNDNMYIISLKIPA